MYDLTSRGSKASSVDHRHRVSARVDEFDLRGRKVSICKTLSHSLSNCTNTYEGNSLCNDNAHVQEENKDQKI